MVVKELKVVVEDKKEKQVVPDQIKAVLLDIQLREGEYHLMEVLVVITMDH